MNSKRSTRRSVNPPEKEHHPETTGSEGSLEDVESILNEIETLVSGAGSEETARPTSVVESQNSPDQFDSIDHRRVDSTDEVEDIRQLTDELDAAIASELVEIDSLDNDSKSEDGNEVETTPTEESSEPDVEAETESTAPIASTSTEVESENEACLTKLCVEKTPSGLLKKLAAPVEALSSRNRFIFTLFAVSMALWVPLVWTAALMTGPKPPPQVPETSSTIELAPDQEDELGIEG